MITLSGTAGIDTPAIDSDTFPTLAGQSVATGFRNRITGGDFSVNPWQRGTSFTAPASGAYTADRWAFGNATSAGVVNILKTADAPTAAEAGVYTQHCLHVDVTTADASLSADEQASIIQRIEGFNAAPFGFGQSGTRYVTLSFWHKHTKTGVYCVSFANSAANRSYVAEYTQDVTDTWEKATVTIPVDTTGTWLYDSGIGVRVMFCIGGAIGGTYQGSAGAWAGADYRYTSNQVNALDSTANNFKIALVQLEAGSVATPFESRPVGTELALCQRYYWRKTGTANYVGFGSGVVEAATGAFVYCKYPVQMRGIPVIAQSNTAIESAGTIAITSLGTIYYGYDSAAVNVNVASGLTVGRGAVWCGNNNSAAYVEASAEL